jgi:hypothetical protein
MTASWDQAVIMLAAFVLLVCALAATAAMWRRLTANARRRGNMPPRATGSPNLDRLTRWAWREDRRGNVPYNFNIAAQRRERLEYCLRRRRGVDPWDWFVNELTLGWVGYDPPKTTPREPFALWPIPEPKFLRVKS